MAPRSKLNTTYHDRRLARRLKEDPEFRAEFERQRREIAQIDSIVRQLDELREQAGMSKAELARAIGKEPSSVRRFFTADINPELKTVAAGRGRPRGGGEGGARAREGPTGSEPAPSVSAETPPPRRTELPVAAAAERL